MMKIYLFILLLLQFSCDNGENKNLEKVFSFPNSLDEVSGIAYRNDNTVYTIQDSGNENKIIVLDTLGQISREIELPNIKNNDWEDLVFDKNENLYIGDFGNNDNDRKDLAIYKIENTDLTKESVLQTTKISFEYPEQKEFPPKKKNLLFDVEAFFEYNNHFYLFTKNRSKGFDGTSYIYKIPNTIGHHKAELIKTITTCSDYNNCAITSAAISPDGSKFVLLSHSKIWLFDNYSKDNLTDAKMSEFDLNHYSQKEAVCFKNNDTLLIADEREKKTGGNLYQASLQSLMN